MTAASARMRACGAQNQLIEHRAHDKEQRVEQLYRRIEFHVLGEHKRRFDG